MAKSTFIYVRILHFIFKKAHWYKQAWNWHDSYEQCATGKNGNAQLDKLWLISKHEKAASQFNDISQTVRIFDESSVKCLLILRGNLVFLVALLFVLLHCCGLLYSLLTLVITAVAGQGSRSIDGLSEWPFRALVYHQPEPECTCICCNPLVVCLQ